MAAIDSARISGNVAFEGVSFHFADQDSMPEAGVLQDINLGVREGEVVAVLGRQALAKAVSSRCYPGSTMSAAAGAPRRRRRKRL